MGSIKAWVDGALITLTLAVHSIFDHVTSYGTSVFEGIRAYEELDADGRPTSRWNVWLLPEHIHRLRKSAALYGMTYDYSDIELGHAVLKVARENLGHTYIRPVVFRGEGLGVNPDPVPVHVAIGTVTWKKYLSEHLHNDGISVLVSSLVRPPRKFFPGGQGKGGANYGGWSQLAKQEANRAQCSEALLQGEDPNCNRFVVDGSGMNLCIVENGRIITPDPRKWNVLHGLTMTFLLEMVDREDATPWEYGDITLKRLACADEVFLLGTAAEVAPVTLVKHALPTGELAQIEIGSGVVGPVAMHLADVLAKATSGQSDAYSHFLTPVPALERQAT